MRTVLLVLVGALAGMSQEPPRVTRVEWLAGCWGGTTDGVAMQEVWLRPEGGVILGVHHDVRGKVTVGFEFMRIEEKDGTLFFQAQPNGKPPTPFRMKSIDPNRVVFESRRQDFPSRVIYAHEGKDLLIGRIEGMVNDKDESMEWRWPRVACPGA